MKKKRIKREKTKKRKMKNSGLLAAIFVSAMLLLGLLIFTSVYDGITGNAFFNPIQPPQKTSSSCIDSDGGDVPLVFGFLTLNLENKQDSCANNILTEYYCNNSSTSGYSSKNYNCLNLDGKVCVSGACSGCSLIFPCPSEYTCTNGGCLSNILSQTCGNNIAENQEACDGTDLRGFTYCPNGRVGQIVCKSDCSGFLPIEETCNGATICGDNILAQGEECDSGLFLAGDNCVDYSYRILGQGKKYTSGKVLCTSNCQLNFSRCVISSLGNCGNGILEPQSGEMCERVGGNWVFQDSMTCARLGYSGNLSCTNCILNTSTCLNPGFITNCSDADGQNENVSNIIDYKGRSYADKCIGESSVNESICNSIGNATWTTISCGNGRYCKLEINGAAKCSSYSTPSSEILVSEYSFNNNSFLIDSEGRYNLLSSGNIQNSQNDLRNFYAGLNGGYFTMQGSNLFTKNRTSASVWIKFSGENELTILNKSSYLFGINAENKKGIIFLKVKVIGNDGLPYEIMAYGNISKLNLEKWINIAFKYDGSISLYANGQEINGSNKKYCGFDSINKIYNVSSGNCINRGSFNPRTVVETSLPWKIGPLNAGIDEVKFWSTTNVNLPNIYENERTLFSDPFKTQLSTYFFEENLGDDPDGVGNDLSSTEELKEGDYYRENNCDNHFISSKAVNKPLVLFKEDPSGLNFENEPFFISLWVKSLKENQGKFADIVSKYGNYRITGAGNKINFSVKNNNGDWVSISSAPSSLPYDEWKHVVAQYNGTHVVLYINGAKVASKAVVNRDTSFSSDTLSLLGSAWPSNSEENYTYQCYTQGTTLSEDKCRFYGELDDVMFFGGEMAGELTASDVYWFYNDEEAYEKGKNDINYGENEFLYCTGSGGDLEEFDFDLVFCKDINCLQTSRTFVKNEQIFITYDIDNDSAGANFSNQDEYEAFLSDLSANATIRTPTNSRINISLPAENLSFNLTGTYTITAEAEKEGYEIQTDSNTFLITNQNTSVCNGNNVCEASRGETEANCADCSPDVCNKDGSCDSNDGENSDNCPEDCEEGECNNDGVCDFNETNATCPRDCPAKKEFNWKLLIIAIVIVLAVLISVIAVVVYLKYKEHKKEKRSVEDYELDNPEKK